MINRDMNKKPMKIGSVNVNVNGLASKEKLIKLHQYFIAEEIDLLLIQEVRNIWSIEKMINIEKEFIYCIESNGGSSNGVGVMYNFKRFTINRRIENPQMMAVELTDEIDQARLLIINIYINPTHGKMERNEKIWEDVHRMIEIAIVNKTNIIIAGDFNQKTSKFRTMMKSYGLITSKLGSTRLNWKNEIDFISTSFLNTQYKKEYNKHWMSDHY